MTKWSISDEDIEAVRFWVIIAIGSLVGLLGAYGREQHEGRDPNRKWLVLRLCVMPFLALAAAALADTLNLSTQVAAFVAALFSLLAYDMVRVIAIRALKKAAAGELDLPTDARIEVPAGADVPAVIKVQATPGTPMRGELRKAYAARPDHDAKIDQLLSQVGDALE